MIDFTLPDDWQAPMTAEQLAAFILHDDNDSGCYVMARAHIHSWLRNYSPRGRCFDDAIDAIVMTPAFEDAWQGQLWSKLRFAHEVLLAALEIGGVE